ncbi:radical SAM protein [Pendulispora rubella]|uniref:Radical SAM protein n=1 Tax=Pendulispora rubella TaxID=2741070 RepID=A0ABZ2L021_9BACT
MIADMRPPAIGEFRAFPLDGAMLYFHGATGTSVRVQNEATRTFTRKAPRVVMFGITNVCNLSCHFCSRDTSRASAWTVESAAEVLEGLAHAGTLEVAFGGGEPFAFRGFERLLSRLRTTTELALNVTTNGTLLSDQVLARLSGTLGQVRVSIYEDAGWRRAAGALLRAGQTWGANVLLHDGVMAELPALLVELAALGARDVSLLSYVGPDPSMMLSAQSEETLAAIVRASPLPCRVSVCFGARLGVHRLFDGMDDAGDCGAGLDFLSITPDKRVQGCSFHDVSFPIESAEDAMRAWRTRRDSLRLASSRPGCARAAERTGGGGRDGIRIWQSFSGNNSGECILVSKFESVEDAQKLLADLLPGYVPGAPYSEPWKELFQREHADIPQRFAGWAPQEMLVEGRTFMARTDYTAEDDFAELRALSWARGGEELAGGVHVHGKTSALAIVRARDATDAARVAQNAEGVGCIVALHGVNVLVALSEGPDDPAPNAPENALAWRRDTLRSLAEDRPWSMELAFEDVDASALTEASKGLATPPRERSRMTLSFWEYEQEARSIERARAAAAEIEGAVHVNKVVLVENIVRKKRVALRGYRHGAIVVSLDGETVALTGQLWREPPPRTKGRKAPDPEPLVASMVEGGLRDRLRLELGSKTFELTQCQPGPWGQRVSIRVETSSPADALTAITSYAVQEGLEVWVEISDLRPIERGIRRLLADLDALTRR